MGRSASHTKESHARKKGEKSDSFCCVWHKIKENVARHVARRMLQTPTTWFGEGGNWEILSEKWVMAWRECRAWLFAYEIFKLNLQKTFFDIFWIIFLNFEFIKQSQFSNYLFISQQIQQIRAGKPLLSPRITALNFTFYPSSSESSTNKTP